MTKLTRHSKLGRNLRGEDWPELGRPTQEVAAEAIDEGRLEEAKALIRYMIPEGKALHDLMCDWVWDLLTQIAKRQGEQEMYVLAAGGAEAAVLVELGAHRGSWIGSNPRVGPPSAALGAQ